MADRPQTLPDSPNAAAQSGQAAAGAREHPVVLHRALYGSLERFLGIVLEQHGAHLPGWLAPVQVQVLPVSEAQLGAAEAFRRQLAERGLRVELRADESLARRIAQSHAHAVPCLAVIGAREATAGTVALRERAGRRELPVTAAAAEIERLCAAPRFVG